MNNPKRGTPEWWKEMNINEGDKLRAELAETKTSLSESDAEVQHISEQRDHWIKECGKQNRLLLLKSHELERLRECVRRHNKTCQEVCDYPSGSFNLEFDTLLDENDETRKALAQKSEIE